MKKFLSVLMLLMMVLAVSIASAKDLKKVAVTNTKWYPLYHIAAPAGWVNDPNGFTYYDGKYHFFYQHYPYDVKWGPMHWGHVVSEDLTHWKHLPIAIMPDQIYDASGGCFSGSGIEKDGKLYLMYTGHVDLPMKPSGSNTIETQNIAVSDDGMKFTKIAENPVLFVPDSDKINQYDFRDPKVWKHDGKYYAVIGSRTPNKTTGQVLLFDSNDLIHWNFKNIMLRGTGNQGNVWECPNFATIDGQDVLIISPQAVKPEGNKYLNKHQSVYMIGHLDYFTGLFANDNFEMLDYGFDFYAPQITQTPDGRTIMIGWLDMWESKYPEQSDGWACMMTIPRELHVKDGKLLITPVKELENLRQNKVSYENLTITENKSLDSVGGETGELIATINTATSKSFAIEFRSAKKEKTVLSYDAATGIAKLDRSKSGKSINSSHTREVQLIPADTLKLHVFLDRSSIEIFFNDGEAVMSSRIYPNQNSQDILFVPQDESPLEISNLTFYTLSEGITQPTVKKSKSKK